jgi:hypothetical protein
MRDETNQQVAARVAYVLFADEEEEHLGGPRYSRWGRQP